MTTLINKTDNVIFREFSPIEKQVDINYRKRYTYVNTIKVFDQLARTDSVGVNALLSACSPGAAGS